MEFINSLLLLNLSMKSRRAYDFRNVIQFLHPRAISSGKFLLRVAACRSTILLRIIKLKLNGVPRVRLSNEFAIEKLD